MSCIYVNGSLEQKEVNDIKVGTGTGSDDKIDVQEVRRWDGTILWSRGIPFTEENTKFDVDTSTCSKEDDVGHWDYDCRPPVSNVQFYDGDSWVPLSPSSDYEVAYKNNTGRLESTGETATTTGYVVLKGRGAYSGSNEKAFTISYTKASYVYVKIGTDIIPSGIYPEGSGNISLYPLGEDSGTIGYKYKSSANVTATATPTESDSYRYAFKGWRGTAIRMPYEENPKTLDFSIPGWTFYTVGALFEGGYPSRTVYFVKYNVNTGKYFRFSDTSTSRVNTYVNSVLFQGTTYDDPNDEIIIANSTLTYESSYTSDVDGNPAPNLFKSPYCAVNFVYPAPSSAGSQKFRYILGHDAAEVIESGGSSFSWQTPEYKEFKVDETQTWKRYGFKLSDGVETATIALNIQ